MSPPSPGPYRDNDDYLGDELRWLDALLALRVATFRERRKGAPASRALSISSEEVEWLLASRASTPAEPDSEAVRELRQRVREWEHTIDGRVRRSAEAGVYLALPHLARLFDLSAFECRAVVVCLAPELDRTYDTIFAYLQDDITRKRPSVDLVLDLLCEGEKQHHAGRAVLCEQGTLARADILERVADPTSPSGSSGLAQFLTLDERILGFLLDRGQVDVRLADAVRIDHPDTAGGRGPGHPVIEQQVGRVIERHGLSQADGRPCLVLHLRGPAGTGKLDLARTACRRIGCHLISVDVPVLLRRGADFAASLRLAFREGLLAQAAVYLEDADALLDDEAYRALKVLARLAAERGWLVFLAGEKPWSRPGVFADARFHSFRIPVPEVPLRTALWKESLSPLRTPEWWAAELGAQLALTPGQIGQAVAAASLDVAARGEQGPDLADLYRACRRLSHHRLEDVALRVDPRATWDDLVLPADQVSQLHEIASQVRNRHQVFDGWGFGGNARCSQGLSVLFSGPPGTGKTLAAEVLAGDLGRDLYKVDLSGVVSKYVGETEKNLSRIFAEAESTDAILLFDEADALFGKRTEISDAHDRYANIETSYLLQRIEAYQGIVILATNLRENIDDAFVRRIRFIVDFPFPDQHSRRRMWAAHIPGQAPVHADVDLDRLAEELKVTGASINNIVLNAAFLAAANGGVIGLEHLRHATRREFQKTGKLWAEDGLARPGGRKESRLST